MRPRAGLAAIGLRNLAERKGRTALTAAGITLGVALVVGALVAGATTSRGSDRLSNEVAGLADVLVSPAGGVAGNLLNPSESGSVATADLARLGALPEVHAAGGVVGFTTVLKTPDGRATSLELNQRFSQASVMGLDLGNAELFPVTLRDGRLPTAGSAELLLTASQATSLDVGVGSRLQTATPTGDHDLHVVGLLEPEGIGRLQTVAFTSLTTAQQLGGRTANTLSFVAVRLVDGMDVETWIDAHQAAVGPGLSAVPASIAIDRFQSQLDLLSATLTTMAGAVLFSGGYLIYLTLSMTVVERTRLYGTLHALGATRQQVRRVVLLEALGMGGVATLAGVGLGLLVAIALNAATARFLSFVGSPPMHVPPLAVVAGLVFGLLVSAASALIPARRAARIDPVAAMREVDAAPPPRAAGWFVGLGLLVVGLATLRVDDTTVQTIGVIVVLAGAMRLVPPLIRPLAASVRRAAARLSPGTGEVAVLHLAKEPSRSASTLSLVMIVMAITFATGALTITFVRSLEEEIDRTFTNDLRLTAASTFDTSFVAAVREHPSVAAASPASRASAFLLDDTGGDGESFIYLDVIEPSTYFDMAGYWWVDGDESSAQELLERGRSVIIPLPLAERLDVGRGDTIMIRTTVGLVPFEVAGTARLSNIPPLLVVGERDGRELFGVNDPFGLSVQVKPGVEVAEAAAALERDLGSSATFITSTTGDLRADARAQILGISNGFFVLLFLAGLIGLLGLANTLAVSMLQRVREIGVLRAVGATRFQVGAMAVIEAITLVSIAFALSVPLGALLAQPLFEVTIGALGDFDASLVLPWMMVPVVAAIGLAVGAVAAIWPVRRAAGTEIDAALRFE